MKFLAGLLVLGASLSAAAQPGPGAIVHRDARGEVVLLRDPDAPSYAGEAAAAARAYLADLGGLLDPRELGAPAVSEVAGRVLVRFPELSGGLPLFGRAVVVALDQNGRPALLLRSPSRKATAAPRAARPLIDEEAAISAARAAVGHQAEGSWARAQLLVLPLPGEERLAYAVLSHQGFSTYRTFVDAALGQPILSQALRYDARARVFETNPGPLGDAPLIEVELPLLIAAPSAEEGMIGRFVTSLNCGAPLSQGLCTAQGTAFPDGAGDLLFDPVLDAQDPLFRDDPFAQVHMFFHVDRIHAFFQALGVTDEEGQIFAPSGGSTNLDASLPAFTNVRGDLNGDGLLGAEDSFDNAFFNGVEIVFGDGTTADFSYDADVIYHEYTHAVISFRLAGLSLDELGVDAQSGGLNEGTADIFAALVTGDSAVGEYAGSNFSNGPIRELDNSFRYPFDLDGEVHDDGELWGGAFWDIKTRLEAELAPSLGPPEVHELLARIYLAAIFSLPSEDADFGEAALALLAFAEELGAEQGVGQEVRAAFEEELRFRGYLDEDGRPVRRIVPLETPDAILRGRFAQFVYGRGRFIGLRGVVPGSLQYSVTLPPGKAFRAAVRAVALTPGLPDARYRILSRADTPVRFEIDRSKIEGEADATTRLTTEPGQLFAANFGTTTRTFFFALGYDDDNDGLVIIDDLTFEDAPDFRGGACAVGGGGSDGALALLALAALLLARRARTG